jgi:hypothetical protein
VVPFDRTGFHTAAIALAAAPINLGVAVQQLFPVAASRNADAVIVPRHRREVESRQEQILSLVPAAQEEERAVVRVAEVNPLEAVGGKVAFVQRWLGLVEVIQVFDPALNAGVAGLITSSKGDHSSECE